MWYVKYEFAVCKAILAIVNYPERFCGFPESCTGSQRISNYPSAGVGKSNFYLAPFNLNLNSISLCNRVAYSVWRHITKLWSTSVCIFTVHTTCSRMQLIACDSGIVNISLVWLLPPKIQNWYSLWFWFT